jgi:hypothetical protein
MATRMNMMKLLQEIRGMAEVTNRRPLSRTTTALALQIRPPALRNKTKQRRIIRISMQDPPDIPHPVKIQHLSGSELPVVIV